MTGGSDGRNDGPRYDGEPIEPELLAIARRLDHDGGTWRRGLPDEQLAIRRAVAAISGSAATAVVTEADAPTQSTAERATPPSGAPDLDARRRGPPRSPGPLAQRLLAVAAMLLVVVLLAVVLKTLGARQATPHPTATATATSAPTATSTPRFPGAWSVAGTLALQAPLTFAPSDPRVTYEAGVQTPGKPGPSTTSVILQRSDDAGKTWHTLAQPPGLVVDDKLLDVHLVVSAFDVHTVFLYTAASCAPQGDPGIHTVPLSSRTAQGSGGVCLTQYRSGDGGASWTRLTLPVAGIIARVVYDGNGTVYALVAQPLYGSGNATPPDRLIASTDAGLTWHVADASLLAQGYGVVSVAVQPSVPNTDRNVSVWVVTNPVALSQSQQASPQYQLWRSDDAGATWRLTFGGVLPYQYSTAMVASTSALYQVPPAPTSAPIALADAIPAVSTDGGATWTKPPTAGLPSVVSVDLFEPFEPVVSGSAIIVPFYGRDGTLFYAWQPGAASWTEVAPPLPVPVARFVDLFAPAAGGRTTLWVVYNPLDHDGYTVASFVLH